MSKETPTPRTDAAAEQWQRAEYEERTDDGGPLSHLNRTYHPDIFGLARTLEIELQAANERAANLALQFDAECRHSAAMREEASEQNKRREALALTLLEANERAAAAETRALNAEHRAKQFEVDLAEGQGQYEHLDKLHNSAESRLSAAMGQVGEIAQKLERAVITVDDMNPASTTHKRRVDNELLDVIDNVIIELVALKGKGG